MPLFYPTRPPTPGDDVYLTPTGEVTFRPTSGTPRIGTLYSMEEGNRAMVQLDTPGRSNLSLLAVTRDSFPPPFFLLDEDNHPVPCWDKIMADRLEENVSRRTLLQNRGVLSGYGLNASVTFRTRPTGFDSAAGPLLYMVVVQRSDLDSGKIVDTIVRCFPTRDGAFAYYWAELGGAPAPVATIYEHLDL